MTFTDTGTQGAKRQSFHTSSPRGLLKRLIDENPRASEQTLLGLFKAEVEKQPDYLPAIIEYWFAHNYQILTKEHSSTPRARAKRKAATDKVASEIKAAAVKMVLMDLTLPNGKALRDSTGHDCAMAGGWFTKIAKRVRPKQIVGNVLSETDVRKLFGR